MVRVSDALADFLFTFVSIGREAYENIQPIRLSQVVGVSVSAGGSIRRYFTDLDVLFLRSINV